MNMSSLRVIVCLAVMGPGVSAALGQGQTPQELARRAGWISARLSSARAQFRDKITELDHGKTTEYDLLIDWAVSGRKAYRRELQRSVLGKPTPNLNTSVSDGERSATLQETMQPDGSLARQVSIRAGQVHFQDVFAGAYKVHDEFLDEALASGKYAVVKSEEPGICLEGPYQGGQRVRFWLSPSEGYAIRKQEIFGDPRYSQTLTISKFKKLADVYYPAAATATVSYGALGPSTMTLTEVEQFSVGKQPGSLFEISETPGTVITDTADGSVVQIDGRGKRTVIGHTRILDQAAAGAKPKAVIGFGLVLLAGFVVFAVGLISWVFSRRSTH